MFTNLPSILFILLVSNSVFAQQDQDALVISQTAIGGTARNIGAGGVFGAVGADYSCVATNPAGLGFFNRGEMTFSPSMTFTNTKSEYLGTTSQDFKYRFVLSNVGFVFVRKNESKALKSSAFSIGVQRIAQFNNKVYFNGVNHRNSYGESLQESLQKSVDQNGLPNYGSNGNLADGEYNIYKFKDLNAYDSWLLYSDTFKNIYSSTTGSNYQTGVKQTNGGVDELGLNWGGNFNNKVYWGVGLNVDFASLTSTFAFTESDSGKTNYPSFVDYTSTDKLKVDGVGVNLKTGIIYKPNDMIRVSAYVHSPTFYSLQENYSNEFVTRVSSKTYTATSPTNNYGYDLVTPWKVGAGICGVFQKNGLLAANYELQDYSSTFVTFNDDPKSQSRINNTISNNFKIAHSLKIGGEYSYETLRLRAGYAYRTSLLNKDIVVNDMNMIQHSFTGGVGYRGKNFGWDLAYINTRSKDYTNLYTSAAKENMGTNNYNQFHQITTTLTFKF
jgi:hypothetical protein